MEADKMGEKVVILGHLHAAKGVQGQFGRVLLAYRMELGEMQFSSCSIC